MKKIWSLLLTVVLVVPVFAQLTPTDSTITNNGGAGITSSVVLDKNKVYLIQGFVYVRNGGTLTIPAGTVLLGEKSSQGSLIIERGGKIFANGTAQEPIVFTSQQPAGLRTRGDWGGIVICGKAANNRPGGNFVVEGNIGSTAGYGDGGIVQDDNDNSGVLRYVRIEFPGIAYTPNNEINGLTLAAVGRGTTIDHVQVSYSGDDAFEFFGGTVNAKYLIAYKSLDDDFDTDFGYSGKIQFGVAYRDPRLSDVSKSEAFETDNDGSGTTASPRTEPVFSNITVIGPKRLATDVSPTNFDSDFYYGIHHRRATRHNLFNSLIMGFDEGGIFLDGATVQGDTANFTYKNNLFTGMSKLIEPTTYNAWFSGYGNSLSSDLNAGLLKAPFNQTSPVMIPQAGSPLLGTASFTGSKISDPFFTVVTYRGAFSGNGSERWDLNWANYDPQGIVYNNSNLVWSSIINLTSPSNKTASVIIGRGVGATDGIDASFGEANLPPVPPTGVDLRLELPGGTQFSALDIRSAATTSSVITYTLDMQDPGVLNWDPNQLGAGKFTLKDGFGGSVFPNLDMKTASSQNVSTLTSVLIEVDTRFNQTIVVGNQWNLVSFPGVHPNSMSVDTLYRGRDLTTPVYKFSGGYVTTSTMTPGEGYWMFHNGVRTYNWNGTTQSGILYPKLNYSARNVFEAPSGWSIIGGYEYNADVNFIRTMPENKRTGLIYKYVPGSGYSSVGVLEPGLGHWVELTGAANIIIPGPFAGTLGKNPADELIQSNWGKILISDAIGQHYTLYAANGDVDLKTFNLPPLPPAGLFDVRFASQRFVEDLSATQLINLTGAVYPVTISVEGMNMKLDYSTESGKVSTILKNGDNHKIANSSNNTLSVKTEKVIPDEYILEQNYPNPFNPTTTIKFSIPMAGNVKLTIYNAVGQRVAELVNGTLEAGSYSFNWDATKMASGLYFYELNTNNFSSVKKMMLLK
ncbi:MAG: T9SS type A sorting domain-containing protein [Ignavibacteriaceae bacterium]|nr:T9SS type A sorting domain-containing protein [Ignavibacteriaceae bacterium]